MMKSKQRFTIRSELQVWLYTMQTLTQLTPFWGFPQMEFSICHVLFDQSVNNVYPAN